MWDALLCAFLCIVVHTGCLKLLSIMCVWWDEMSLESQVATLAIFYVIYVTSKVGCIAVLICQNELKFERESQTVTGSLYIDRTIYRYSTAYSTQLLHATKQKTTPS